ncbi:MAG: rod shape-determining protein MreC [Lachnospiraceae bacterium]|nr:rod shape-determining protein MreC [Lachnospiraceae bacterium]
MNTQHKKNRPRGGLLILIGVCLFLMLVSSFSTSFNSVLRNGVNRVLMPMQRGMNKVGSYVFKRLEKLRDLEEIQEKTQQLEEELALLRSQNAQLKLKEKELNELQVLLKMQEQYPDYESLGAHVIGKSSGNYFQSFMIDRGSRDGVRIGMNVLAHGGLVGLVTAVGDTYATVETIINSGKYVSAMSTRDGSHFLVYGDLQLYSQGLLGLENASISSDLGTGDMVVTSNISDLYLPGLLIGYVESMKTDSNQLTRTGTVRPAADFDSLDTVLVILTVKEKGE